MISRPLKPTPGDSTNEATRALDSLRRIVGSLRSASRSASESAGVTGAQLFVLQQLALEPQQSINTLAERTRTRQNSVSDVIARLVARGLVNKAAAPDDARRAEVSLTAAGRAVVRKAPRTLQTTLIDAFHELPSSQRRQLANSLESWVITAGLGDVAPTMFFERAKKKRAAKMAKRSAASAND